MNIRWFGAVAIIVGCGGFGFRMAAIQRKQEKELRDLVTALDILSNELRYRLSPLPELCSMVAKSLSLPMRASGRSRVALRGPHLDQQLSALNAILQSFARCCQLDKQYKLKSFSLINGRVC